MLVVDASVAVKFVVREAGSDAALEILGGPETLIAPEWMLVETASVLWKKVKFSALLETHAHNALVYLPEFFGGLFPDRPLLRDAFPLAFKLRHPVYDCLYLALAIRENARLVTADRDLHKAGVKAGFGDRIDLLTWSDRPDG